MYVIIGINPEHMEIKQLSWGNSPKWDSRGPVAGGRIMEWLSAYTLVLVIEQGEDGLSPSIRRFRKRNTWELVSTRED